MAAVQDRERGKMVIEGCVAKVVSSEGAFMPSNAFGLADGASSEAMLDAGRVVRGSQGR
jgi:hypothetical protein